MSLHEQDNPAPASTGDPVKADGPLALPDRDALIRMPKASFTPMPVQKINAAVQKSVALEPQDRVASNAPALSPLPNPDRRGDAGCGSADGFKRELAIRRWLFGILVALTSAAGALKFWSVLRVDGVTGLELALMSVFVILFSWIAMSFWLSTFGAITKWFGLRLDNLRQPPEERVRKSDMDRPRVAIVMPVYNEDSRRVFAGLTAICESLRDTGCTSRFDIIILSDSNDAESCRQEQTRFFALRQAMQGCFRVFYRRRARNLGRKSGNIADFCRNWGHHYGYMVVLDADSIMSGDTLATLVDLMDANPNAGLLQVPPEIVGRHSLFARIQQFASSVYGPVFSRGLACLQGPDGNYWGHNAIIRVNAFMAHCGLPVLSGKAPLGGEILSHDFVEAALMRRAGWDIWMLPELAGSFEEPPTTADDYLARDRRWCQGNLQHARIVPSCGLRLASRFHLALGVMSYLSSPLWLLLIVLSIAQAYQMGGEVPVSYVGEYPVLSFPISHFNAFMVLISATGLMLFGPKVFAYLTLLADREKRRAHGGCINAGFSVVLECIFATLFAPVAMLSHSWFVVNNLIGRSVEWSPQQREEHAVPLVDVANTFLPHTLAGLAVSAATYALAPQSFWWLSPLTVGMLAAIPTVYLTCAERAGAWVRDWNLFLIPSETSRISVLDRVSKLRDAINGIAIERPGGVMVPAW